MWKSRFYKNNSIAVLIISTVVMLMAFDVVARVLIYEQLKQHMQDIFVFRAEEIVEMLQDLDDGLEMINDSFNTQARQDLENHVQIASTLIDDVRARSLGVKTSAQQKLDALKQVEHYRSDMNGSLGIFSPESGMLLYPGNENSRLNIYFNENNRELLELAVQNGSVFGSVEISNILRDNYSLDGYFLYDKEWNWLIFALQQKNVGTPFHTYGERITILDSVRQNHPDDFIDSVVILDADLLYEYGVEPARSGRKLTQIDLTTNRNLTEVFSAHLNDFAHYVVSEPYSAEPVEKLAYVLPSPENDHIIIVEGNTGRLENMIKSIMTKVRLFSAMAAAVLIAVLRLLYQNFVTLTDPISDRYEEAADEE